MALGIGAGTFTAVMEARTVDGTSFSSITEKDLTGLGAEALQVLTDCLGDFVTAGHLGVG